MKYLQALLIFLLFAGNLTAQEEVRITYHADNQQLTTILDEVHDAYSIKLAYDYGALSQINASIHADNLAIPDFFAQLLSGIPYGIRQIGKTWVVYYRPPSQESFEQPTKSLFAWSGRIIDHSSREPLPFANVIAKYANLGTSTNADGFFRFEQFPSDTATLEISYIGYATLRIKLTPEMVNEAQPLELYRDFSILPVAAIVGEESKWMENASIVGITTLNADQLGSLPSLGESDPIRSIQLMPGINGTSDQSANLYIRGGRSDENLVLFDGFNMYHLDHFYGVFGALNQDAVKNIRLYRGWFPARFGGRLSSVIEITGKEGNQLKPKGKATVNFTSVSASVEAPIVKEKASIIVSARRSFTDVIFSPLYQQLFNNLYNSSITQPGQNEVNTFDGAAPDYHFYDVTAKLTWHPGSKDVVQFSAYRAQDNLLIEYDAEFPEFEEVINYRDESSWGNAGAALRWGHAAKSGWYSDVNLSWSNYKSALFARDAVYEIPFDLRDTVYSDQTSSLQEWSFKGSLARTIDEHAIEFGTWINHNRIQFDYASTGQVTRNIVDESPLVAVYAQDEFTWLFDILANAGVRMSYFGNTNTVYTEPRIALSKPLWFGFSASVAYGRYFQVIRKVRSQNLFRNTPDYWALSDLEQVPVGRNDQIQGQIAWEDNRFRFQVEGYYRWLKGTIEDPLTFRNDGAVDNNQLFTGDGSAWGGEVMLQKLTGQHTGWVSATVGRVYYDLDQLEQKQLYPSHDQLFEMKWAYIFRIPRWKFSATFVYGSGKPYSPVLGTYTIPLVNGNDQRIIVPGDFNSGRLAPYHRLDLGVQYTLSFKKSNIDLGLFAYNVYNRKNVKDREYFVVSQLSDPQLYSLDSRDIVSLGFVPALKMTVHF
ncbi:MAG: carboxypeptidase-like regulatory domain-containing protein [Flavobacteriales bacterium]|nr:carboxypeptidase-like regulatory domain-containing protein [Flavobacteriales bacterium]